MTAVQNTTTAGPVAAFSKVLERMASAWAKYNGPEAE